MQLWKVLLIVLVLLAILSLAFSGCSGPSGTPAKHSEIPDQFEINKRALAWSHTLDVVGPGKNFGSISQEFFTWTRSFTYTDGQGSIAAKASARFLTWGAQVDVEDGAGKVLGTFKEEVWESLFKMYSTYTIYDAAGNKIATSKKSEFFTTEITLYNNSGAEIARLYRGAWNWPADKWSVSISNRELVDVRVLLVIAAYKSSVDADRRSKSKD